MELYTEQYSCWRALLSSVSSWLKIKEVPCLGVKSYPDDGNTRSYKEPNLFHSISQAWKWRRNACWLTSSPCFCIVLSFSSIRFDIFLDNRSLRIFPSVKIFCERTGFFKYREHSWFEKRAPFFFEGRARPLHSWIISTTKFSRFQIAGTWEVATLLIAVLVNLAPIVLTLIYCFLISRYLNSSALGVWIAEWEGGTRRLPPLCSCNN